MGAVRAKGLNFRRLRLLVPTAFTLALVMSASADPGEAITLSWSTSIEACPTGGEVREEVVRLLGGSDAPAPTMHVTARAQVTASGAGVKVLLATTAGGATGTRTFEASNCKEAADATALILALMIDPARVVSGSKALVAPVIASVMPSVSAAASSSASAAPPVLPSVASTSASASTSMAPLGSPTERAPKIELLLGTGPLVDVGSLPSVAPGWELSIGARRQRVFATLAAQLFATVRRRLDERPSAYGDARMRSAMMRGGLVVYESRLFTLAPLIGLELASVSADGHGVVNPSSGSTLRLGVALGLAASLRVAPRVSFRGEIDGIVPTRRVELAFDGLATLYREPAVLARVHLGVGFAF